MVVTMSTMNQTMMATNGSYELYDGRNMHQVSSLEETLLSPPGGPSCHPPDSPKQTREIEKLKLALDKSQQETNQYKKTVDDLKRRFQISNLSEAPIGLENMSNEEDARDTQIRHLQRQVTVLRANLHKKEELDKRLTEMDHEKNQAVDLMRSALARKDELEVVIRQKDAEIERLRKENQAIKASYDSTSSPPSSSTPTNGASASMSQQSMDSAMYSRELDCLHKMVDTLRATVMEQRQVFMKMGLTSKQFNSLSQGQGQQSVQNVIPRPSSKSDVSVVGEGPSSSNHTSNNVATTNTATIATTAAASSMTTASQQRPALSGTAWPVRQPEENCEIIPSNPSIHNNLDNSGSLHSHSSSAGRGESKEIPPQLPPHNHAVLDRTNSVNDANTNHLLWRGGSSGSGNAGSTTTSTAMLAEQQQHSGCQAAPFTTQALSASGGSVGDKSRVSPRRSRPGSVSSSDLVPAMEGLAIATTPITGTMDVHLINKSSGLPLHPRQQDVVDSTDINMDTVFMATGDRKDVFSDPRSPGPLPVTTATRKTSQTEVIDRRSELMKGVALPPKSHTEVYGKNPNILSHQQQQLLLHHQQLRGAPDGMSVQRFNQMTSEANRLQQPPGFPLLAAAHAPNGAQTQIGGGIGTGATGGVPLRGGGLAGGGIPVNSRPPLAQKQTVPRQDGHLGLSPSPNMLAGLPPFEPEGCIISPVPSNYSNTLSNISDVRSSSSAHSPTPIPHQYHQPLEQQQRVITTTTTTTGNTSSSPPSRDNIAHTSSRLCPVCNQDFGYISIEDFQTHIFDCFDKDNGPETLQAEPANNDFQWDGGLVVQQQQQQTRTCPMCQMKFGQTVTQPEFEQHVHRHFGEEAFEVL